MNEKKISLLLVIVSFLSSSCFGRIHTLDVKKSIPIGALGLYSADLTKAGEAVLPAVVTLVRKRVIKAGSHTMNLESFASGVLVSGNGYIITNYHTIKNRKMSDISVTLAEDPEKRYTPKIIKTDPYFDLALIKIERPLPFPFVSIIQNFETVKAGDIVLAVGSSKIVKKYKGYIQKGTVIKVGKFLFTDAKVSPGFSGGGVFNGKGELIALSTKFNQREHIGTSIIGHTILNFLSDSPVKNKNAPSAYVTAGHLSLLSDEIAGIAEKNIPFVVQVTAKPTKEDYTAKMMKISKIAKLNKYSAQNAKFKYWYPASGLIVSKDGYIVTAYYQVVDNCENILVDIIGKDGRKTTYKAKVVAFDDNFNVNLALLKIEPKTALPYVKKNNWSKKPPAAGHLVFTIGNSLYFEQAVSSGIVSKVTKELIQTDAAINNGNLGGPLIDDTGSLIGLLIKREINLNGVSFAVFSDMVLKFIDRYVPAV